MIDAKLILGGLLLASTTGASGFFYGQHIGKTTCEHAQMKIDQAIEETAKASRLAAAEAIAGIKITNRTIHNKVQHEITEVPVYSSCIVPASGVQQANQAIAGQLSDKSSVSAASADSSGR